jgi:hypothetical protein
MLLNLGILVMLTGMHAVLSAYAYTIIGKCRCNLREIFKDERRAQRNNAHENQELYVDGFLSQR